MSTPESSSRKNPQSYLVASLTSTTRNLEDAQELRTYAIALAQDGSRTLAVEKFAETWESDDRIVNIKAADESQIQRLIDDLRRDSTLKFSVARTKVLYLETITLPVLGVSGKHEYHDGSSRVVIDVFPVQGEDNGALDVVENRFTNDVRGEAVPKEFIPDCERAFRNLCQAGRLIKAPITRVGMRLLDGACCRQAYFFPATFQALTVAFSQAKFVLLEPVLNAEIEIPDEFFSAVLGDIGRRGIIVQDMKEVGDRRRLSARCTASSLLGYESVLGVLSERKGKLTTNFIGYQQVPESETRDLVSRARSSYRT
jgi:elongation factor G